MVSTFLYLTLKTDLIILSWNPVQQADQYMCYEKPSNEIIHWFQKEGTNADLK